MKPGPRTVKYWCLVVNTVQVGLIAAKVVIMVSWHRGRDRLGNAFPM